MQRFQRFAVFLGSCRTTDSCTRRSVWQQQKALYVGPSTQASEVLPLSDTSIDTTCLHAAVLGCLYAASVIVCFVSWVVLNHELLFLGLC